MSRSSRMALAIVGLVLLGSAHAGPRPAERALTTRAVGFKLVSQNLLDGSDLSATCKRVLEQTINCDEYVSQLGERTYFGSLEDPELTAAVCTTTCKTALTAAKGRITNICASTPDLATGLPILTLIDSIVYGWNDTCLTDNKTGDYCNDIIDSWEEYDEIKDMPEEQLCSYCYGTKLRMMQQSPYSVYDELFAEMLGYVNENCGVESPTTPLEPPINVNNTEPTTCYSGNTYTAQGGDTCDSVALANSVSAATLYYNNPSLLNCTSIDAGIELCLPQSCEDLHTVKEGESCVEVGVTSGTSWMNLIDWNLGLDSRCSNLWSNDPFWGRVICVSAPGGEFEDGGGNEGSDPGNGNSGGEGGSGDGYTDFVAELPDGNVAKGTTELCGVWIQAEQGRGCAKMLVSTGAAVPIDLFLDVNPSLETAAECDGKLVTGTWYCLNPHRYWDDSA